MTRSTLSEATGEDFGSNTSTYGVFAHRECYENHPELYPFFRNLLKQFEQQTATHGTNGPTPPPPAGQPR